MKFFHGKFQVFFGLYSSVYVLNCVGDRCTVEDPYLQPVRRGASDRGAAVEATIDVAVGVVIIESFSLLIFYRMNY